MSTGGAVTSSSTSSGASSAASETASKTWTSATSGTDATASWISVSVRSETTHASISRPSKVSTSSGVGLARERLAVARRSTSSTM